MSYVKTSIVFKAEGSVKVRRNYKFIYVNVKLYY